MNEQELVRKLNSVGKAAFVLFFNTFKQCANEQVSRESCIDLLVTKKVSNSAGAAIRVGNAQQIFRAGREREALEIISDSRRLHPTIVALAQNIMSSM
jgi:hypothetical protein